MDKFNSDLSLGARLCNGSHHRRVVSVVRARLGDSGVKVDAPDTISMSNVSGQVLSKRYCNGRTILLRMSRAGAAPPQEMAVPISKMEHIPSRGEGEVGRSPPETMSGD